MKQFLLFALLIPTSFSFPFIAEGAFHVSGSLSCHGRPYSKMPVYIYEKNFLFEDKLLKSAKTNDDGSFYIQSSGEDLLSFNPYVYVPNYCGAVRSPDGICTVKAMMVRIPEENISPTHIPIISYRIGDIELSEKVPYEEMGFGSILGGVLLKNEHCMQY
ncbi:CRE-TTR-10 protein [Caenorhabditis remanei]|uniref:CRE-TTR-10 protein n=2 Tax=Caenorhabditis remanei TaxID=31234 RepID=E3M017_CAERE|nr:CRE-TTR-10 protein [Caenorhabditis remanei]